MKFGALKSAGHNIADSLASGIGLMIGIYEMDIFGEASGGPDGFIEVDFLNGTTIGSPPSESLRKAVVLYARQLPSFFEKHQIDVTQIAKLKSRYSVDRVYGPNFLVTVTDVRGRSSVDQYVGVPGRKIGLGKQG